MLCYVMLCYVMLCYVMLCYVMFWAYGVVVSMFDFHRRDRGLNLGRGGKIS